MRKALARLMQAARADVSAHATGYAEAMAGVAVTTLLLAGIRTALHTGNLSSLYILIVLYLAVRYGQGPAMLASVLAFLSYDYFFIPPFYTLTIADPAQWIALLALLATSLVAGQLTARVRLREVEAQSERLRVQRLYELAQVIASARELDTLLEALTQRVVEVFAPYHVIACAVLLPDGDETLRVRASNPGGLAATPVDLTNRDVEAHARRSLSTGTVIGLPTQGRVARDTSPALEVMYFMPLRASQGIIGVLVVAGPQALRELMLADARMDTASTGYAAPERMRRAAELFRAFRDQIGLAIERALLQQDAIHMRALEESDRLKTALLAAVTHDLRTPLASIKAAVGTLLETSMTLTPEEQADLLDAIDVSADRLNRQVGNLLDLSRLEAGVAAPEKDWHLISEVVVSVLDRLELTGAAHGYTLDVRLPPELPLALFDFAQIEQVLTNLLENAMKYSPAGSTVTISVTPGKDELSVAVHDEGIGIPQSELRAIFDKFYRVQGVRLPWRDRASQGTGLGLAISSGIIEAHGGRIWAESAAGHGATVTFTLPLSAPPGTLPELRAAEAAS